MILKSQKRIAAALLKSGKSRIKFDESRLGDIKESITKTDIRSLIDDGAISLKPKKGISRYRVRKRLVQKRKGRQSNQGSRKGKRQARLPKKTEWKNRIRIQRKYLVKLRLDKKISTSTYSMLYRKAKGGLFRSKHHIYIYIKENDLTQNEKK